MGDRIRLGNVSDSTVAVGRGARATSRTDTPSAHRLRAELEALTVGLATSDHEDVDEAHGEVVGLAQAVSAERPSAVEVEKRWQRVRAALMALGVTGSVAFGADLGQIASSVHDLLGTLGH